MSEWKEYLLEMAIEPVKETYMSLADDNLNYIGLEHIEQETLKLNSIGSSKDVISNKFIFQANDILFGKLRPYFRKVVKPMFSGICSTDIWVFRAKDDFLQDFLFYFLANWDFVNTASGGEGGTKMPRADWKYLSKTKWIFPPIPEQKAIASVLSSLDDKIDLLHRQNKTLEAMAETLFRQWFIEEAQDDWEEISIGELFSISSGKAASKITGSGDYPVFGANGIIGYTHSFLYEEKILLTGRVGTLGNIFRVENDNKIWPSDNTLVILPEKYYNFVYFSLKKAKIEEYNVGSTQPLIRQSDVKEIKISLPYEGKLNRFEIKTEALFQKINCNNSQIRTLEKLRDNLLPKLMSGEVRVNYA